MIKRTIDIILSCMLIIVSSPVLLLVAIAVKVTSKGPVMFRQNRVGKDNLFFTIYKFRTMLVDTPNVATYLLDKPDIYLTPIGKFLRKTSIDELPQLFNILRGNMSFVGPRPVIEKEEELIRLRTTVGVHKLVPGLTGWAQINGRDNVTLYDKVNLDKYYLQNRSIKFDFKIMGLTFLKVIKSEGVIDGNDPVIIDSRYENIN